MSTILNRIAAGDTSAVRDSLDEYGDLVWRLAHRRLGGRVADIEDAVQEVFIEVWLKAKAFDPAKGSEAAFVVTVAHRRIIDLQRRGAARDRADKHASLEMPASLRPENAPSDEIDKADLAIEFKKLPSDEASAIWLAIHRGMTHRQISEATGTPVGTIKTRLRRGLARLYQRVVAPAAEPAGEASL